jgi:hypothetical protein
MQKPIFKLEMSATVTVFKSELKNKTLSLANISAMSSETKETANAFAFFPKPGKLYELVNYLRTNGINYQTNFRESANGE